MCCWGREGLGLRSWAPWPCGNGNGGETGKMRIKGEHRGGGVHARRERKENSENVQEFPLNRSHTGYFCFLIEGGEFFLFFKQFHCLTVRMLGVSDIHLDSKWKQTAKLKQKSTIKKHITYYL